MKNYIIIFTAGWERIKETKTTTCLTFGDIGKCNDGKLLGRFGKVINGCYFIRLHTWKKKPKKPNLVNLDTSLFYRTFLTLTCYKIWLI